MWSYSGDPSASDRDAVRFAIGDTDSLDPLLSDEEIAYLLTGTTALLASIAAAESLSARFARAVDRQVGNLRISSSQRAASFAALAATLRGRKAIVPTPYAGGISDADKYTRESDSDRVKPSFYRSANRFDYDRYERYG